MAAIRQAIDITRPAWTKRELLVFPSLQPACSYALPFFLHTAEDGEAVLFLDAQGQILDYCKDELYEALDQQLLWVRFAGLSWGDEGHDYNGVVYFYSNVLPGSGNPEELSLREQGRPSAPEEVLLFADFFRKETVPSVWERIFRPGEDEALAEQYVTVGPPPETRAETLSQAFESLPLMPVGNSLRVDPGIGRVVLRRPIEAPFLHPAGWRLHLRAHFFDTMQSAVATHWLGLTSNLGAAAVGLNAEMGDFYGFASGGCPDGHPQHILDWQCTAVARSPGWHLLELLWENGHVSAIIDGEPTSTVPAQVWTPEGGHVHMAQSVWIVGKRGNIGCWAGMELLHTPIGHNALEADFSLNKRHPWQRNLEERGQWQFIREGQSFIMRGQADPPIPLESTDPVEFVEPFIPPPPRDVGSVAIECWSLPGPEADLARIERVMGVFLERLAADGVVLPSNIQRLGLCREVQHSTCYVYRFGTRRLHVTTRELEGGRLCLVVRCGGGFFDFAEFARRNGNLEHLKLQRRQEPNGREVVRLSSVLCNRQRRITESRSGGLSRGGG